MWKFFWRTVHAIIETLLPSKVSRLVAQITICLIIGILLLPVWWVALKLPTISDNQISILRYTVTPSLLFASMLLIYILVVRDKYSFAKLLQHWKVHEKITLSVGTYHDVFTKRGDKFLRITLKDISHQHMPPPYESDSQPEEIKTQVATLCFDPGFIAVPGSRIKQLAISPVFSENCFYMSKVENAEEERYSMFLFKTTHVSDGEFFFRCFVDHINPVKKEVELDIFFIWLNPGNP